MLLQRAKAAIGVALVRRAVGMVHSCIPRLAAEEEYLALGCAAALPEARNDRSVVFLDGDADGVPEVQVAAAAGARGGQ